MISGDIVLKWFTDIMSSEFAPPKRASYNVKTFNKILARNLVDFLGAVKLTDGVYYIGFRYLTEMNRHQDLVRSVGGAFYDASIVVGGDVRNIVNETMINEINAVAADLIEFQKEPPRNGAIDERLDRLSELRYKIGMHSEGCGLVDSDLIARRLTDCETAAEVLRRKNVTPADESTGVTTTT